MAAIDPPEGKIVPEEHPKAHHTTNPSHSGPEPPVATESESGQSQPTAENMNQLQHSSHKENLKTQTLESDNTQDVATETASQASHHRPKRQAPHNSGFLLHQRIGKGSFATVYKGEWGGDLFPQKVANNDLKDSTTHPEKQTVAIKVVHQSRLKRDRRLMDIFEGEMAILKQMKHPHVVHLIDVIQTTSDYNLIMEYCSMGELSRFIRGRKKLIRDNADAALLFERYPAKPNGGIHNTLVRHILSQLSSALAFLREQHLVHRDLKPQNLLLKPPMATQQEAKEKGYIGRYDLPVVKVADFGFARFLPATSMAETMCGSPLYMAPEILNRERYNALADLWSVGAVTYEMIMGKPPFPAANPMELMKMIDENKSNVVLPPDAPADLAYFVKRLLVRSPDERLSFDEFFSITSVWAADPESESKVETKVNSTSSETVTEDVPVSSDSSTDASTARPTRMSYMEYLRQHGASDVAVHSPSPSPEASMSHSHLIPRTTGQLTSSELSRQHQRQGKQPVSGDSDNYVFIEKRTVEVNSLADDMQSPSSAQRRLTNPDKQPRRRRLSSIAYGASPTNALAQALLKSSVRLFGTSKETTSGSRLSRDPSMESLSQNVSSNNSPDVHTSLSAILAPMKGGEKRVIDELEQLATIGKVVSLYADIKYTQLDIDSVDGLSEEGGRISESHSLGNHHNFLIHGASSRQSTAAYPIQSPSQIDPYLQLKLASEALALHLKSLSILSRAMECVSAWWEQEHGHSNVPKHGTGEFKPSSNPGINSLVQWVRDKFNECMDKAEIEKIVVAKLKKETSSAPPEINAERLLFDRGLEMAKTAACQEASAVEVSNSGTKRDLIGTSEMNYGTAVWMLKALMVTDKDGEDLSEDDRVMVERMMAKVATRLSAVRAKHMRSPRTSSSFAMSAHSSNHSALSQNDMRLTPP